jgi:transcriptional regulator with XRE-family HTH domain
MNRIKDLRTERQMKQSTLADALHISRQAISKYEREDIDLSTELIRQLCEIFGVTADYLLGFSSVRVAALPEEDYALAAAYHAAPPSVRAGIDALLAPYREEAAGAAG